MSTANSKRIPLKGTEHIMLPGARAVRPTDPHQLIEVSVVLNHRKALPKIENQVRPMSHDEFASTYGADPAQLDKIRQFARDNNLQVLERGDEVLAPHRNAGRHCGSDGKGIWSGVKRIRA